MVKQGYPFTAIIGQNQMKRVLMLNIINPQIGGVLINGQKGTAKSTAVRAIGVLMGYSIVEVPLSVSEDRLVGSIDMEKTIETGRACVEEGLLKKAHNGILYVDEVNLLQDYIVDILLDVSANKVNHIEREGISYSHPSNFVLIGTMNMEEGLLRPHFLDRFGLYVSVSSEPDPEKRVDIVSNRLLSDKDPKLFSKQFEEEQHHLLTKLLYARELLPKVRVTAENYSRITEMCLEAGVEGHRGDLVMVETAKAIAAYDSRTNINENDLQEAALYSLAHRKTEGMPQPQQQETDDSDRNENDEDQQEQQKEQDEQPPKDDDSQDDNSDQEEKQERRENEEETEDEEKQEPAPPENDRDADAPVQAQAQAKMSDFQVGDTFKTKDFGHKSDRKARRGQGKRTVIRSAKKSGSYIHSTMQRINGDLAFDATIRAAAPYQSRRDRSERAIAIEDADIREKVRQRKMANLLVFVVDASGSMGANKRMIETKSAIISLLKDAYVKRDRIALVVFSGDGAEVVLPPTRSAERGYKLMEELRIGGKTSLNDGLSKGMQVINSEMKKSTDLLPMMIVITDGKGNVSIDKDKKPRTELYEIGEKIKEIKTINTMVIDIEKKNAMGFGIARELAAHMGSKYYKIEDLKSESILNAVENVRR